MSDIVICEAETQQVEVRLEGETLWLSLQQLADLFRRDKSVISWPDPLKRVQKLS